MNPAKSYAWLKMATPVVMAILFLIICPRINAQTSSGANPSPLPANGSLPVRSPELPSLREDKPEAGPGFEEILVKKRINMAKEQYHENVDRAREMSQVGAEILEAYQKSQVLTSTEIKKLEHMEKLAKKVREQAGGTDSTEDPEEMPKDLKSALVRLSKLSDELRDKIEKTSYLEVSMGVINRANQLLELVKYVRTLHPGSS